MTKKIAIITTSFILGANLFASEIKKEEINPTKTLVGELNKMDNVNKQEEIVKQDDKIANVLEIVSKIHKLPLDVLYVDKTERLKENNLTKYVFGVNGYEQKGVVFVTDDGLYLPTNFFTKDGVNIYQEEFVKENSILFQKEKEAKIKIKQDTAKHLIDIENGKFGDIIRTIKGNQNATETLYLFTDVTCPFCKMYEEGKQNGKEIPNFGLKHDLNVFKEVKVIMYPLYSIPGHESSIQRSLWFYENTKNVEDPNKILEALNKATNADLKELKVDAKKLETYDKFIKNKNPDGFTASGLIGGTPTLLLKDGTNLMENN